MELGNLKVGNSVVVEVVNQAIPHTTTLVAFTAKVTEVDISGLNNFAVKFDNGVLLESTVEDLAAGLVGTELA
jgi:hypothetical protein